MLLVGRYQQAAAFMADCTGCCYIRGSYGCRVYVCEDYYDYPTNMCRDFDEKLDESKDDLYNCGPVKSINLIQPDWFYDQSVPENLKMPIPPHEETCPQFEDLRKARMVYSCGRWKESAKPTNTFMIWSMRLIGLITSKNIMNLDYTSKLNIERDFQNKVVNNRREDQKLKISNGKCYIDLHVF